jgi:hypothetical protein
LPLCIRGCVNMGSSISLWPYFLGGWGGVGLGMGVR